MSDHFRTVRSQRIEPQSDFSDPWPDNLVALPLTRAQKRKARIANIIRYGVRLAGLALLAFLYVRGGV